MHNNKERNKKLLIVYPVPPESTLRGRRNRHLYANIGSGTLQNTLRELLCSIEIYNVTYLDNKQIK